MPEYLNDFLHFTNALSLLISLGYVFIIVLIILDWRKGGGPEISDQLIFGLGLLSLIHGIFELCIRYVVMIHGSRWITGFLYNLLYMSLILCMLLFSSWLALHYCLKIVSIRRSFYLSIQRLFPSIFPWILLPSILASLLISAPAAYIMSRLNLNTTDVSQLQRYSPLRSLLSLQLYLAFTFLVILTFSVPVLVSIASLYRHVRRMRKNAVALRDETARAHVGAVKTLVSLLAYNLMYFALLTFSSLKRHDPQWKNTAFLLLTVWHVIGLPILIRGSGKLRRTLRQMWPRFISLL